MKYMIYNKARKYIIYKGESKMKKCLYCGKDLEKEPKENYIENKVGYFCNEDHFDKYILSLTPEEYIEVQNSFCVCSDD